MPLKFQPRERSVIMCDFRGYEEPEMVKKRPVVVIARNRHNGKLVTVVPLKQHRTCPFGGLPPQNEWKPLTGQAAHPMLGKMRHDGNSRIGTIRPIQTQRARPLHSNNQ